MAMKKVIRLSESDLIKVIKRVIQEQDTSEGDASKCAKTYVDFMFSPSVLDREGQVIDGGELHFWNNNQIPELDDTEAYSRFLDHLKYNVEEMNTYDEEECEGVTFEDLLPFVKNLYRIKVGGRIKTGRTIDDKFYKMLFDIYRNNNIAVPTKLKRRMNDEPLLDFLGNNMRKNSPNDYGDMYDYAEHILDITLGDFFPGMPIPEDADEIYEFLKDHFSPILFGHFQSFRGNEED